MKNQGIRLDAFPRALAWSPDGAILAVGLDSGILRFFDGAARPLGEKRGHERGILALAWNPLGGVLASGGEDGRVRLWAPGGEQPIVDREGGGSWVGGVAWSTEGKVLATAAGRSVRFWTRDGLEHLGEETLASTVEAMAWQGAGGALAAAAYGAITVIQPGKGKLPRQLEWRSSLISVVWSPDGCHLAAGTQEKTVIYWPRPLAVGEPLQMSGYQAKVKDLAWNRSSRYLACGGGADLTVWDVSGEGPAGTRPIQLAGHEDLVGALHWQPEGDLLASGARDGSVWLWNPGVRSQGLKATRLPAVVCGLAWTRDGTRLAIAAEDGTLVVAGA